jgi:ribosomal protein S12 methylthiotransferase
MSQMLRDAGLVVVSQPDAADILIVNTCGFIESAKQEAIAAILDLADHKQPAGRARCLIVTGCLAQRYADQIKQDLPEADDVLGTREYGRIVETVAKWFPAVQVAHPDRVKINTPADPDAISHLKIDRMPSTPRPYAYLKIAEGCSNHCAYCAIPGIRGEHVSRPFEELVHEAERFSQAGYDELILIAQDTGRYGLDRYGRRRLPELLAAICALPSVRLVRLLYIYSDGLTDELISLMGSEAKIAHYLDVPIQHASDRMLKAMNRRDNQSSIRSVMARLRQAMPDLILRSTVMVGFPGEREDDFADLMDFLREIRFERLGCFIFSPEEDTPAFTMKPRVRKPTAERRYRELMALQQQIAAECTRRRIGQIVPVTLESLDERGIFYIGRSYGEAPDVDPVIYVAASTDDLKLGQTVPVRIISHDDYDMTGVTVL